MSDNPFLAAPAGRSFRIYYVVHAIVNLVQVKHEFEMDKSEEAMALATAYKRAEFPVQLSCMTSTTEFTKQELHIPGASHEPRI